MHAAYLYQSVSAKSPSPRGARITLPRSRPLGRCDAQAPTQPYLRIPKPKPGAAVTAKRKTLWIVGGVAALLTLLVALRVVANLRAAHQRQDMGPLPVDVDTARMQSMPVLIQAVGQVQSEHSVQLRPQ